MLLCGVLHFNVILICGMVDTHVHTMETNSLLGWLMRYERSEQTHPVGDPFANWESQYCPFLVGSRQFPHLVAVGRSTHGRVEWLLRTL